MRGATRVSRTASTRIHLRPNGPIRGHRSLRRCPGRLTLHRSPSNPTHPNYLNSVRKARHRSHTCRALPTGLARLGAYYCYASCALVCRAFVFLVVVVPHNQLPPHVPAVFHPHHDVEVEPPYNASASRSWKPSANREPLRTQPGLYAKKSSLVSSVMASPVQTSTRRKPQPSRHATCTPLVRSSPSHDHGHDQGEATSSAPRNAGRSRRARVSASRKSSETVVSLPRARDDRPKPPPPPPCDPYVTCHVNSAPSLGECNAAAHHAPLTRVK